VLAEIPEDYVREVKRVEGMFAVTKDKLKQITHHFVGELEKGRAVRSYRIPRSGRQADSGLSRTQRRGR